MNSVIRLARHFFLALVMFQASSSFSQPLCDVLLRPAFNYTTSGTYVTFQDSSRTYGLEAVASWNFGDGTSSVPEPYHIFDEPGTYTVCLTLTSGPDPTCSSTFCRELIVPLNDCGVSLPSTIIHQSTGTNTGSFIEVSVFPPEGSWLWEFGDGTTSTETQPSHTWAMPGSHFVSLTRTSGECSSSVGRWISVDGNASTCGPELFIDFSIVGDGETTVFMPNVVATGVQPALSIWSYGDGQFDTTMVGAHTYIMTGSYQTCLLVGALDDQNFDTCFSLVCQTHEVVPATAVEEFIPDGLTVWPNPSHGMITLEIPGTPGRATMRLLDLLGRPRLERALGLVENQVIELSGIPAGEYILELHTDEFRSTRRVIVLP
jgi:PKD domain